MNPLDSLDPSELVSLSDSDFQETVKKHARAKVSEAFTTIEDVMASSDDDQARLVAASKILAIAKVDQEDSRVLPSSISEEVFRIALAGLGQIAKLASSTTETSVLKNVTPARSDPRLALIDDSPLNVKPKLKDISYEEEQETKTQS
jgi:hypothetical protein